MVKMTAVMVTKAAVMVKIVIKRRRVDVNLDFELEKRIIDFSRTFWTFLNFSRLFWTMDVRILRWTFLNISELCSSSVACFGLFFSFTNFIGLWRTFFNVERQKFKMDVFKHSWTLLVLCEVFLSLNFKSPHWTLMDFPSSGWTLWVSLQFLSLTFSSSPIQHQSWWKHFFRFMRKGWWEVSAVLYVFYSEIVVHHHSVDKEKQ